MTNASDKPRPYTREHGYNAHRSGWDDERVELLRRLWADGNSAGQIASRLGGAVTRNAVIAKVWRLGLSGRSTTSRAPMRKRVSPAQKAHRQKLHKLFFAPRERQPDVTFIDIHEPVPIPPRQRKTLQQLDEHHCRWPVGDPRQPDFHFCGAEREPGVAYCQMHQRRAFDQPPPRRRAQPIQMVPTFESFIKEDA